MIAEAKLDPSDIVTHKLPLDQAEYGYRDFNTKMDVIKVVVKSHLH